LPTIKKIVIIGESRGITLPKGWLDYNEKILGKPLKHVQVAEVNNIITIWPIPPDQEKERKP
jgi:hypothetical protein